MVGTRADGIKMMQKLLLMLLDTLSNTKDFRKMEICSVRDKKECQVQQKK